MKIYVASSWRNTTQPLVVHSLRNMLHEVYDFKDADGFSWSEVDPNWQNWTPDEYIRGLNHPCAERGFKRDMDALKWADVCIMVMPCGPSAAAELGYAVGAGKPTAVFIPGMREPDLMIKMADFITTDFSEIHGWLRKLKI